MPLGRPLLVRLTKPEKVGDGFIVYKTGSKISVAKATPGEEFEGASVAPFKTALKVTVAARANGVSNKHSRSAKIDAIYFMF